VYVGALYLPAKETAADKIIAAATAKRVSMHMLYDEVSKEKLTGGWSDGFENNHSREEFDKLKPRLEQFNQLFTAVRRGDVVFIDYLPAQGTRVTINGEIKGNIAGEDFARAVFKVWLGEHPADNALKQGMLGLD
jgi:Chalcone isomerase-like